MTRIIAGFEVLRVGFRSGVTRRFAVFEFIRVRGRVGVTRRIAVFEFIRVRRRFWVTRRIVDFKILRVRGRLEVTRRIAVFAFLRVRGVQTTRNRSFSIFTWGKKRCEAGEIFEFAFSRGRRSHVKASFWRFNVGGRGM